MEDVVDLKLVKSRAILACVATRFGFSIEEILGGSHRTRLMPPRYMAIRMMERQGYSSSVIGKAMNRDHSTILWSVRQMNKLSKTNPVMAKLMRDADQEIVRLAKEAHESGAAAMPALKNRLRAPVIKEAMDRKDAAAEQEEAERAERARQARLHEIAEKLRSSKFERLKREHWSPASIAKQLNVPIEYVKQALGVYGEATA